MATTLGTTFDETGTKATTAKPADGSGLLARGLGKEFRVGRTPVVALEGVDLSAPAGAFNVFAGLTGAVVCGVSFAWGAVTVVAAFGHSSATLGLPYDCDPGAGNDAAGASGLALRPSAAAGALVVGALRGFAAPAAFC